MVAGCVLASAIWGFSEPTGEPVADFVWRGLVAATMFYAAGVSDRFRLAAAVVGVAALSAMEGLAAAPLWLVLFGVALWVRRPRARWVVGGLALVAVVAAAGALSGWQAAKELRAARQELAGLQVADIDGVDELDASVAVIENRLDVATDWIDAAWAVPARFVPLLGAHLNAAGDVLDATDLVFGAVEPLRTLDVSDFAVAGGIDLALVTTTADDISALADAATRGDEIVSDVSRSWLLPFIEDDLDDVQEVLTDGIADAERASRLLRGVWRQAGGEQDQRWFVLLCSPVESRASCGFPGNYVELVITDGRFEVFDSGRVSDLEPIAEDLDLQLTVGGDYQARYERFGVAQTWRNLTLSPHWPDVAGAIRQLYGDMTGRQVDVVAGVNTEGMAAIMQLTGPVEIEGLGTVSPGNVRQRIEIDQYDLFQDRAERVDVLADLTDVVVDALLQVDDVDASQLRAIGDAAQNHGIVVHAKDDPELLFADAGVDGALPEIVIAVTWQNAAANKLDAYMDTSMTYAPPDDDGGCIVFAMTNAAPDGLTEFVEGDGSIVPAGWQRTWVSTYSPLPVESVRVNGEPVDFGSEAERGSFASSLYVDVPRGETAVVIATLADPVSVDPEFRVQPASRPTVVSLGSPEVCGVAPGE